MGLSNKSSNKKYVKVVYENQDKENGKPSFAIVARKTSSWDIIEQGNNFSGTIVSIEKDQYEHRGKIQHKFKIGMQSEGENYSLELGYSYYSRNVLNSLAGIDDFTGKEINFSIYRNNDGFTSVFTTCNEEKTEWSMKAADLPKKDTDKWLASFQYFIDIIAGRVAPTEEVSAPTPEVAFKDTEAGRIEAANAEKKDSSNEVDDLPF